MTQEDRAEIRQMLTDIMSGHTEEMKGRYNVIHANLVQIKEQTTKTNGRVTTIEEEIDKIKKNESQHYSLCPNNSRLDNLEKSETSRKAIFRFIGTLWGITVAMIGILIAVYKLIIEK